MNHECMAEYQEKRERINRFLNENGYDAIIFGTTANFAWATCGGDSHILLDSQGGSCILLFTADKAYCIANKMDAARLKDQEIGGLPIEVISLKWFEESTVAYAMNLVSGKRIISDIPISGAELSFSAFYQLHYPLTLGEVNRYRKIGKDTENAVLAVAGFAEHGMTANDIQTKLLEEFSKRSQQITCMIIGVDDEISKYRHPLPADQKIDRALMLVLSGKRYGLNVPITRMIYFDGDVPEDIEKRYQAACTIEANTILSARPGAKFYDISMMQKKLYEQFGYANEWEEHFAGGLTGYMANDASFCTNKEAVMVNRQSFNWYVTITGVNVEETMLTSEEDGVELVTVQGIWPEKAYQAGGEEIRLPQIMVKD